MWRRARHAIVVSPTARLRRRIADVPRVQKIFPNPNQRSISAWIRALRLHQWIKNLLIFVPALAAHKASDPAVISSAVLAFVWFGLCASATYVINDLLDLEADRAHAHKRLRPFASGEIPIVNGAAGALMLLTAGIAGSILTINGLFVLVFAHVCDLDAVVFVDAQTNRHGRRLVAGGALHRQSNCGRRGGSNSALFLAARLLDVSVPQPGNGEAVHRIACCALVRKARSSGTRLSHR